MAFNAYRNLNTTNDRLGELARESWSSGYRNQPGRGGRVGLGHQPEPGQASVGLKVADADAQNWLSRSCKRPEGALT